MIKLDPTHNTNNHIDFIKSANHVVLQVWPDGKAAVFVEGSDDAIAVWRDGDATAL